jgi:serine/threonine protein kinase
MESDESSHPGLDAAARREAHIRALASQLVARWLGGDEFSHEQLAAWHPDLMPELGDVIRLKIRIHRQVAQGKRAGPKTAPIVPLSEDELNAPLSEGEAGAMPQGAVDRVPGYRILREISSGGQAAVFEGTQVSTGRRVAVKVVTGGPLISSVSRERFEREVRAMAALDHPNIVGVLERGQTDDHSLFLVMDYIDGVSLETHIELLRREEAGQANVIRLFVKIAQALQEAHRRKIIHRDIKPSNIRVDMRGEPHILDFGLVHLNSDQSSPVTMPGHIIGSLPWASPEQANGDRAKLGPPSDVYSLGVVLYQALVGRPPYPVVGTVREIIGQIVATPPGKPSPREKLPFGPVGPALVGILNKALAKRVEDRYADAAALAADLSRYLEGKPLSTPRPSLPRNLAIPGVLVAVCVIVLALGAMLTRTGGGAVTPVTLPSRVNEAGMRMIQLPLGGMMMGSPSNAPERGDDEDQHSVTIGHHFWICATEVTRRQYLLVMGTLPPDVPSTDLDQPVDHVTWADAQAFCAALTRLESRPYHLPTEPQWEYACRAGSTGLTVTDLPPQAWFKENSGAKPHDVATRQPNAWGLYDMLGGVSEWCEDGYVPHLAHRAQVDPAPRYSLLDRVIRGGEITTDREDCRFARRWLEPLDRGRAGLGFRVVIDPARPAIATTQP